MPLQAARPPVANKSTTSIARPFGNCDVKHTRHPPSTKVGTHEWGIRLHQVSVGLWRKIQRQSTISHPAKRPGNITPKHESKGDVRKTQAHTHTREHYTLDCPSPSLLRAYAACEPDTTDVWLPLQRPLYELACSLCSLRAWHTPPLATCTTSTVPWRRAYATCAPSTTYRQ